MNSYVDIKWYEWNPGLHNGDAILQDVIATLPAADSKDIPWLVKLFENPASPIAFPGAINLARHDALHVLLGRGLRNQDEAFVIGFTMGTNDHIHTWQIYFFRWIITHIYPVPYKLSHQDLIAFELGFNFGHTISMRNLHCFSFEKYSSCKIDDLRHWLGINPAKLHAIYRLESLLIANSRASHRLDVNDKPQPMRPV